MNTRRNSLALIAALLLGGASTRGREASAQPAAVNVSGAWTTQFAGAAAAVTLTQVGANVVGTYVNTPPLLPGALAGVMRGRVLTGRWTDASSSGGLILTFSADGSSFVGTWGRAVTSATNGGPWVGQRR